MSTYEFVVVDDDVALNTMVTRLLNRVTGYHATNFLTPQEAIEYCQSHPVDILVTDVSMPKMMSGPEMIARMHALGCLPPKRIIMTGSHSENDYTVIPNGVTYKVLLKPFTSNLLYEYVTDQIFQLKGERHEAELQTAIEAEVEDHCQLIDEQRDAELRARLKAVIPTSDGEVLTDPDVEQFVDKVINQINGLDSFAPALPEPADVGIPIAEIEQAEPAVTAPTDEPGLAGYDSGDKVPFSRTIDALGGVSHEIQFADDGPATVTPPPATHDPAHCQGCEPDPDDV